MSKSSLEIIPRRVKAFGRLWAIKFIATNPRWQHGDAHIDEWYSFGDYDLNLWCEDGYLSVCAYAEYEDEDGFTNTDHSDFVYLVRIPSKKRKHRMIAEMKKGNIQ
jgi:hypothetical protein